MTESNRDALRRLLQRVDEVRGLSDGSEAGTAVEPEDAGALVQTLGEIVEELERSHRRLIETNVQLVSLREVASRLATAPDVAEASRIVTRYLQRAFGFDQVGLLLVDHDGTALAGAWTDGRSTAAATHALEVPLPGERGALARAFWLGRTVRHPDGRRHPPATLPESHPLADAFADLGPIVCVPLLRGRAGDSEGQERCGGGCAFGNAALFVPPTGADVAAWEAEREEAQAHCLACERLPLLGVIAVARRGGGPPIGTGDLTLVESIALSVAPMVENARLFQALRRSERFRENVLNSMASALVAVNLRGEVLTFNHSGEELLGWSEAEILGRPVGELFGPEGEALIESTIQQGRDVQRRETFLRARDGSVVPVRMTATLLRDDARQVYGAIATFLDLTPIKRAEEHARQLDRLAALGRFTSSVAHEIRNPLTGIGAGVQYLARALAHDAPQRENLEFILGEIARLDRIVQELFDVTHPRRLDLKPRPIEDTVRRAFQSIEPLLAERHVVATIESPRPLPPVAHDPDQMQQVFINLVKNAVEASESGGRIEVRLEIANERSGHASAPTLFASVRDEGHGIDTETQRTLFEPFFTTKPGGTGLGLYITHDIVKRHGGSLSVQSEPGSGATFRIELPLEPQGGPS